MNNSSVTDGYVSGGNVGQTKYSVIQKYPFAISSGTTVDTGGDLLAGKNSGSAHDSRDDAFISGANTGAPEYRSSTIEKFPFSISSGTSSNVGDLSEEVDGAHGLSSPTDGFSVHGELDTFPSYTTSIKKFPFAISSGSSTTVGNLDAARVSTPGGNSSVTEGFVSGGYLQPIYQTDIWKFPFAITSGTIAPVADLSIAIGLSSHQSD